MDRFKGLGLAIHGAVLFAVYTGGEGVRARKEFLVAETIKTQSPSGYIGLYTEEPDQGQLWREWAFHDAAYIVYGLAEDYRHFRAAPSLEAGLQWAAATRLDGALNAPLPGPRAGTWEGCCI